MEFQPGYLFRSPRRPQNTAFQPIDDMISLALALAQIIGALSATDRVSQDTALKIMAKHPELPDQFKEELCPILNFQEGQTPLCTLP